MTTLFDLMNDFSVSRPIFRLELSSSASYIEAETRNPVHQYTPTPIPGNLLSELVCENYNESFDPKRGCFTINKQEIASRTMEDIRNSIGKFIEKNLQMRNPRQSKLYRWTYRNMPTTVEVNDVLVMVYKYLRSFTDKNMKASDPNHVNNAIALLEAIMEKHDEQ